MTGLAEAALAIAWTLALEETVGQYGVPLDADGRLVPAAIIGLGKFGGRELTTGSDLDLFVVYGGAGLTDGEPRVEAHVFYDRAVEVLSGLLSDITAAWPSRWTCACVLLRQRLRHQRRRARAPLPRVGGSVGAPDPHPRPARGR
jgi:hypothetical protein